MQQLQQIRCGKVSQAARKGLKPTLHADKLLNAELTDAGCAVLNIDGCCAMAWAMPLLWKMGWPRLLVHKGAQMPLLHTGWPHMPGWHMGLNTVVCAIPVVGCAIPLAQIGCAIELAHIG